MESIYAIVFSFLCFLLHLFHGCWLHCARESPQHLLFHGKLQSVMESEKIQKSKIYLCAISCECEHTLCHKIYHIMHSSSVNLEILSLSTNPHFLSLSLSQFLCILHEFDGYGDISSFSCPIMCTP